MELESLSLGSYISYNNSVYEVVGQNVNKEFKKVILRDLSCNERVEKDLKECSECELLDVESKSMQFSYQDGKTYYFMDIETYQQLALNYDVVKDVMCYVIEDSIVTMNFVKDYLIAIIPPLEVELTV